MRTPAAGSVDEVVAALGSWQRDDALVQLHPGDLGWAWRHGEAAVAESLRVWWDDGVIVAVGLIDGPTVLRMTVAPDRWSDDGLARRVLSDLDGGALAPRLGSVEIPTGTAVHAVLRSAGWTAGEAWTPLARDLTTTAVEPSGLQVHVVGPDEVEDFTAVHRSAWGSETFTDDVWEVMSHGAPFRNGRCLLGRDAAGRAVAGVTVWSAGDGQPGLLEPMGVHSEHRGLGHGRAVCVAAAAALQELGASTAWVCTPSSLRSAVATYRSADFTPLPERLDCVRPR
ncbi:GNAT family N-acetyltransferase [Microbacterium sp. M1A1_1b]